MPGRWKKQRDFHAKSLPRELKNKINLERYGPIFIHSAPARRTGAFHRLSAPPRKGWNMVTQTRSAHGSLSVNQVESAFMPLRSILLPSHTANAMGTDIPALNCVSFASPVSIVRFTTMRQVGPL